MNSSVVSEVDWPGIQKELLDLLYPLPCLKMFAVTGTNGKTTTADLILQLGELSGKKGLSIGTLGVREYNKTILDFGLTSPSLIDLRKFLFLYGRDKDFCVLEASSHALIQKRYYGIQFDMGGWLSFSQDHLDYHKTMEEYFSAKLLIFDCLRPDGKVFIPSSEADLFNKIHNVTSRVQLAQPIDQNLPLFFCTRYNRSNLEVAVSILEETFHLKVSDIYFKLNPPEGRFYIRPFRSSFIIVDFAHTPDALENICQAIQETYPGHKLKILFGCGGDRDRSKRAIMGAVADRYASEIYVTSDNPRTENPEQIMDDIIQGISSVTFHRIVDRPHAVQNAFTELRENEILLLAGKGHEDYILINEKKYPYSDIQEVEKFLARNSE
jgi:UDP-N-acetylmuramoyl-L-alanyl-D-glutamate--2,6-diaminopimelate ligase